MYPIAMVYADAGFDVHADAPIIVHDDCVSAVPAPAPTTVFDTTAKFEPVDDVVPAPMTPLFWPPDVRFTPA